MKYYKIKESLFKVKLFGPLKETKILNVITIIIIIIIVCSL